MIEWKVVSSISDKHPEYGYPMGKILCINLKEAEEYVKESEYNDCYIENYADVIDDMSAFYWEK